MEKTVHDALIVKTQGICGISIKKRPNQIWASKVQPKRVNLTRPQTSKTSLGIGLDDHKQSLYMTFSDTAFCRLHFLCSHYPH